MPLSDDGLSLLEIENRYGIRIRDVIGNPDRLELVVSVTDIPAHYPLAAGNALAISEMETGIDRSIVGLTARLQPCACRSRFERCISNCTRQIRSPNTLSPCSSANTPVQRLSNICG